MTEDSFLTKQLRGKILFVFSDPGGAKPILSIAAQNVGVSSIIISDRHYSFYESFKIPVIISDSNVELIVNEFNPDIILTGTSYKSEIEKEVIKISQLKGIKCFSFVDHWTNFSSRFLYFGVLRLPDQILVIDEIAKIKAVQEGIPESKISIIGNPYHSWLKLWKPVDNKVEYLKYLGIEKSDKKIFLYAPDPLTNVDGKNLYGYDEISVLQILIKMFNSKFKDSWIVLINGHPNQDRKKIEQLISHQHVFYFLPQESDINTNLYYADVVFGFFSSALIEAKILQKKVLRYRSNINLHDPIEHLQIGLKVNNNELIKYLENYQSYD